MERLLKNDVILSVITNGDCYTVPTVSNNRLIGMSGNNRLGYGNYSFCSQTVPLTLNTVFNSQYKIVNVSVHYQYVELAWTTGGASYDLTYFESTHTQFCTRLMRDVFSFATLADTPSRFTGNLSVFSN